MVGYAVRNEVFPLTSAVEPNLGGLSPTVLFKPWWCSQGRGGANQKQAGSSHQRMLHVRLLFFCREGV